MTTLPPGCLVPCSDCGDNVPEHVCCIGCGASLCGICSIDNLQQFEDSLSCLACIRDWKIRCGDMVSDQVARLSQGRARRSRREYSSSSSESESDSEDGSVCDKAAGDNAAGGGGRRPRKPIRCESCTCIPEDGGWRCGGCKEVTYCGAGCQRRHWKIHRIVCGKLLRRY